MDERDPLDVAAWALLMGKYEQAVAYSLFSLAGDFRRSLQLSTVVPEETPGHLLSWRSEHDEQG